MPYEATQYPDLPELELDENISAPEEDDPVSGDDLVLDLLDEIIALKGRIEEITETLFTERAEYDEVIDRQNEAGENLAGLLTDSISALDSQNALVLFYRQLLITIALYKGPNVSIPTELARTALAEVITQWPDETEE